MKVNQNRVDEFIQKVNETTDRNDVKEAEWFQLEKEYLAMIEDKTIPRKETAKIWFKCRYSVVDMICSGVRYEQEQKRKKQR